MSWDGVLSSVLLELNFFLPSSILLQTIHFELWSLKFPGGGGLYPWGVIWFTFPLPQCLLLMTIWLMFLDCLVTVLTYGTSCFIFGDWCNTCNSSLIHPANGGLLLLKVTTSGQIIRLFFLLVFWRNSKSVLFIWRALSNCLSINSSGYFTPIYPYF